MKHVVCVSGPEPEATQLSHLLCSHAANGPWVMDWLNVELRERCHGAYKLFNPRGGPALSSTFNEQLDVPLNHFHGLSPREAYRRFYGDWVVPTFGRGILGKWFMERTKFFIKLHEERLPPERRAKSLCVVDATDPLEILPIIECYGVEKITLLVFPDYEWKVDWAQRSETIKEVSLEAVKFAAPHLFLEVPDRPPIVIVKEK